MNLQPLAPEEMAELLDSLAIAGLDRHRGEGALLLHRRTGGNPLYALETVKAALAAPSGGPQRRPGRWRATSFA